MSDKSTAYHEAGHAAADLILDHGSASVTIVKKDNALGSASSVEGDDMTAEGMENMIIALYAGAEAQKRVDVDHETVKLGSWGDDEKAEDCLRQLNSTEEKLRERTAALISEHWELVELIASELLIHETLQYDELAIMLDVYRGESTMEELEEFRVRFLRGT